MPPEKPPPQLRRRPTAAAAGSWVRSLHCKSMAADDVAAARVVAAAPPKTKLHHPLLPRAAGCGSSGDTLISHVVVSSKKPSRPRPRPKPKPSPEPAAKKTTTTTKPSVPPSPPPPPGPLGPVPALTELPAGHSSRQVVEIIFLSSWSSSFSSPLPVQLPPGAVSPSTTNTTSSGGGGGFPGVVEMLFRVHNPARAVARFEDYRAAVRARAGGASPRSAADGNEMMRFSPAPAPPSSYGSSPASASTADGGGEDGPRRPGIRTFDGSGGAHASASATGGGGGRRRAMFLCRVIAGRVAEAGGGGGSGSGGMGASKEKEQFDSVRVGGRGGELVVFDRRAVLPCFLIIYKL